MALVIVETLVDQPLTDEILGDTRTLDCLAERNAQWRYSLLSSDRCRMICTFDAPDAESVRASYRKAGTGFHQIWTAQMIDPEGVPPAWNEAILKVLEGTYPDGFTDEQWNAANDMILPCYEERGVEWVRSYVSLDRTRVFCELNASDAEVIREAYRKASIPFDRVWTAQLLKPEASVLR